jgi:4-alpha-glucanotransferase
LASIAELAIIPMQDILELDGSHRMNTPGTTENNWLWHFQWKQLSSKYVTQFTRLIEQTNRQCRKKD